MLALPSRFAKSPCSLPGNGKIAIGNVLASPERQHDERPQNVGQL
jgi:hypothetical protein